MADKKGNSKALIIVLIVLIVLGGIGGAAYYFYQKDAPKRELAALGYNEQQVTVIMNNKLAEEVIKNSPSELFSYALSDNINNISHTDFFLIADSERKQDLSVKEEFDILKKMMESGYDSADSHTLIENLSLDDLNNLLRMEKPANLEVFTEGIAHGYSIPDSLKISEGNSELAQMIFDETISFNNVKPLLDKQYSADDILALIRNLSEDDYMFVLNMKYIPELAQLSGMENFDMNYLPRYLMSLRSNRADINDVVNWVNNDNDYIPADEIDYSAMYHDETIPDDYMSYTACINKQYALPADYEPSDLEQLPYGYHVLGHPMRHVAANAFVNMSDGSVVAGYERILAQSNYRSYSFQKSLYDEYVAQDGVSGADIYSARPGHSEHQTGLVTDIGTGSLDMLYLENYSGYEWLLENAHNYGFILRYPEGKEYITGYEYESWHFRYVGVESATVMYERDWTLDEYALLFN